MITKKLFLRFPKSETEKPIVYHLVKNHNLIINIFRAKVTADDEGYLVIDVTGKEEDIEAGLEYVRTFDVTIDPINKGMVWDAEKCTHCGNCLSHCPTHALHVTDQDTKAVGFTEELCIECLSCLTNCPFKACSSVF